jgi:protein tyrosine/serine phosphatase
VLYRSAQPDEAGWKRLRDHYGIRTVIDLREDAPDAPWAVLEREFCAANGIRTIKLPVGDDLLTDPELQTIVETISDPQNQPVLVHCELGRSRTGIAIAAYRVAAQGWSFEAALAESQIFKKDMEPGYVDYLKQLADGEGRRPALTATTVGLVSGIEYP